MKLWCPPLAFLFKGLALNCAAKIFNENADFVINGFEWETHAAKWAVLKNKLRFPQYVLFQYLSKGQIILMEAADLIYVLKLQNINIQA